MFLQTGARGTPILLLAGDIVHDIVHHDVAGLTGGTDWVIAPCQLLEGVYTVAFGSDDGPHLDRRGRGRVRGGGGK